MKPYIVILSVRKFDRRDSANMLENQKFLSFNELRDRIKETKKVRLNDENIDELLLEDGDYIYYELTEFMELCNDEEFDINNYWVSYVFVEE